MDIFIHYEYHTYEKYKILHVPHMAYETNTTYEKAFRYTPHAKSIAGQQFVFQNLILKITERKQSLLITVPNKYIYSR